MRFYSKEGNTVMDVRSLHHEGGNLILKGKVMDAMMISIYLKPEDIWKAKDLLSWSIIWHLPFIILKGFWINFNNKKKGGKT